MPDSSTMKTGGNTPVSRIEFERVLHVLCGFAGRAAQSSDPKMREAAKNLKAELAAAKKNS